MNTTAHTKKLEIILASVLTLLFLAISAGFIGYSYFKFKTPIKKVVFTPQGSTSMLVSIETEVPLKTHIEYGTTDLYLNNSEESETFETTPSHTIWGLLPEKKHFYRVVGKDEAGKEYTSKFYQY